MQFQYSSLASTNYKFVAILEAAQNNDYKNLKISNELIYYQDKMKNIFANAASDGDVETLEDSHSEAQEERNHIGQLNALGVDPVISKLPSNSFADPNSNGTVDAGDEIFNVQSSLDTNITLKGTAGITVLITFTPSGITNLDDVEVLVMCDGDGFGATAKGIVVTITGNALIMTATEANKTTCL